MKKSKEEWREYFAKYRAENKSTIAKNHRNWRLRNQEKIRLKNKAYREKQKAQYEVV
jgi:hypothetical protein